MNLPSDPCFYRAAAELEQFHEMASGKPGLASDEAKERIATLFRAKGDTVALAMTKVRP